MTLITTDSQHYTDIASAIRSKAGVQDLFKPSQMAGAILSIPTGGGVLGSKTITDNGTYYASADSLDGYSQVTVNVQGGGGGGSEDALIGRTLSEYYNNTASVVGLYAMYRFDSLTSVEMPAVTNISNSAFFSCSRLSYISFPACEVIGSQAFINCSRLADISFPLARSCGIGAFASCYSLATAYLQFCTVIENEAFAYCSMLSYISAPVCERIGSSAFSSCQKLTEISFPSCSSIGQAAFSRCTSASIINLPVCTFIGGSAFADCSKVETAWLPMLSSVDYAVFNYCNKLMSLYLLSTSFVPLYNPGANFNYTPMSKSSYTGSFGSIFVRASLYDTFVSNSNWSAYSERIVSLTDSEIEALPF